MSSSARSDLYDLDVVVHHETEKAVLVSADGERATAVWIPKSQCEIERKPRTTIATLTARETLLVDKGLL